jgi:hypothetical protein
MQERVDEIDSKQQGDAKPNQRFIHGAILSKTAASARIGARDHKEKEAKADINDIRHHPLLALLRD